MKRTHLSFLLIGCLFFSHITHAALLKAVEVRQHAGKMSLFFSLSAPVPYRVFNLVNPNRVVVDFEHTALLTHVKDLRVDPHLIHCVRSGHPVPGTLRLVFEVTQALSWDANPESRGVRLDLQPAVLAAEAAAPVSLSLVTPSVQKALAPVQIRHAPSALLRPVVVVLDPGHGGKDPGAQGPTGIREKHLVLSIARRLEQMINAEPGMKAVLTRRGDYYLELRERLHAARRYHADVFVSIHADAFHHPESRGASVFALSQRGATSEAARWLAEKENYSELGGVNLSELDDKNKLVRTVLIDLSQTATVGASLQMGEGVLKSLHAVTHLHMNHVEQARFVVLKSLDIPSILIETGFISNPQEEQFLNQATNQTRLTRAIFRGIKQYFLEYPPQGTLAERWSQPTHGTASHTVLSNR